MAKFEFYKTLNRFTIEKGVAMLPEVQAHLDGIILERGAIAEAKLDASPNRTGASAIEVEKGKVDRYVVLYDERGAAAAIEYGRSATGEDGERVHIPGPAPLRTAFPEIDDR